MSPQPNYENFARQGVTQENRGVVYALLNVAAALDAQTQELRTLRELFDGSGRRSRDYDIQTGKEHGEL